MFILLKELDGQEMLLNVQKIISVVYSWDTDDNLLYCVIKTDDNECHFPDESLEEVHEKIKNALRLR